MNKLEIDLTGTDPERVKHAIDILTGNQDVRDVSLNAVAEAVISLQAEIRELYKPGSDDIGGRFHKDIKDIDDTLTGEQQLNTDLYNTVASLLNRIDELDDAFGDDKVSQVLYETTGDYKFKPIYTDEALHRIKARAELMIYSLE